MPSRHHPFEFTRAIVRPPGDSVARGLRAGDGVNPDPSTFRDQHRAYVSALHDNGVDVTVLEPLEAFPDSVFVEDVALCLGETAIALRPGAQSRRGEAAATRPALESAFDHVLDLPGTGHVDGGDILITDREVLVGLSRRTDTDGFAALAALVTNLGMPIRAATTPPGTLHLKTACGLLDAETIFATGPLAATGCFADYRVVEAPPDEDTAANLIRVNDQVFVARGHPRTIDKLTAAGYPVTVLDVSQAARVDGGLSCLSLRFGPRA